MASSSRYSKTTPQPFTRAPLLPSSRCYHLNNLELASNSSQTPIQTLRVPGKPSYENSRSEANAPAKYCKENERTTEGLPERQNRRYQSGLSKTGPVDRGPFMRNRNFRLSLLHQRAFHHEPYKASLSPVSSNLDQDNPALFLFHSPNYLNPQASLASQPTFYESQRFWLTLYFCFNLGLTLYNKGILVRFPFPYTLTALHALCGSVGGYTLIKSGTFVPARLNARETVVLVAFSVLYAVNIVISNVSLHLVTVPFHQVVRAATPIFTMLFSAFLFGLHSSRAKLISLIPVIAGVGLATYGDYYFTYWGFLLTLLGTVLAALKTIFTNVLQSPSSPPSPCLLKHPTNSKRHSHPPASISFVSLPRLPLHPLDLLILMSPLAFIQCVVFAHLSGELDRVRQYSMYEMTKVKALALLANGCIAFGLNVVSFTANKKVGALSMTVAANVKQVLTILFAVVMFDLTITTTNWLGILLTLVGGVWYARMEYQEKEFRSTGI